MSHASAKPDGTGRAHLGAVGIPPVQLDLDERADVDAIDRHVDDLAVDVGVDQFDAAHHDTAEVDAAELGVRQIDSLQPRAAEVGALEPRAAQIRADEVRHATTLTFGADAQMTRREFGRPSAPGAGTLGSVNQSLPGNLVLRTARLSDIDQIASLLTDRGEAADAFDHRLVVDDPEAGYQSCAVAVDGDRVVSTATLLDETLALAGITIPAGQVERNRHRPRV